MLFMIKESIRGGMRHANHQYTEANCSYMKDHDKNKCPLYILYWDVNNWCVDGQCNKNYYLMLLSELTKYLNLIQIP